MNFSKNKGVQKSLKAVACGSLPFSRLRICFKWLDTLGYNFSYAILEVIRFGSHTGYSLEQGYLYKGITNYRSDPVIIGFFCLISCIFSIAQTIASRHYLTILSTFCWSHQQFKSQLNSTHKLVVPNYLRSSAWA